MRRGCETVGPREAAVIPITPQLLTHHHHRCFSAGVAGRDQLSERRFCFIWGTGSFNSLTHSEGTHWPSLLGGPWGERGGVEWAGEACGVAGRCSLSPGLLAPSQLLHPVCVGSAGNTKRPSAPSTWPHAEAISFPFSRTTGDRLERK